MRVIHACDPLPKSIFLAGPTPREGSTQSWRPEALRLLEAMAFEGNVIVPETADWLSKGHYEQQAYWEWEGLATCTVALFWVPRELEHMPAFTTNVEFGYLASSGKVMLGFPKDAPKMRYLEMLGARHGVACYHTLPALLEAAVTRCRMVYPFALS